MRSTNAHKATKAVVGGWGGTKRCDLLKLRAVPHCTDNANQLSDYFGKGAFGDSHSTLISCRIHPSDSFQSCAVWSNGCAVMQRETTPKGQTLEILIAPDDVDDRLMNTPHGRTMQNDS